ncbi:molybdenum cofactor sulfurase [Colletotrichum truncatum]|uniref:Molybdenum cofactor sulfurase n=1 Tax=Colletotrichum truncatum TaxID=5467 RepID=A0ACC3Z453_COLTU|nr:molybdenum cofactor sulfurase [Colletotrichum truncatum]KAF6795711.1 molybdenum cofactor sulfurase [Colletotrichum truncatum]
MIDIGTQGYNSRVESFRDEEYPMLKDSIYLDHAGSTLYSKSLIDKFSADMMSNLLGNPHSASSPSQYTTSRIEDIRLRLLGFFHADPVDFDLVFVANATAGIKLVAEAFRASPDGFSFAHHEACHTSIIGVREEARNSECLDDFQVQKWISGESPFPDSNFSQRDVLFAYTAQSHMDGRRYPLAWTTLLRQSSASSRGRFFTILDAASLTATSPLDLSDADSAPDFTILSLYKIFGFPDLGALIVRKQAEPIFDNRRYFGGGTVDMVVCSKEQWHSPKAMFLHERLEDGTLPFHSILALDAALDVHATLYGSIVKVASHTAFLTRRLYKGLAALQHGNGLSVCTIYSQQNIDGAETSSGGPLVAFNIRNSSGAWISLYEFEKLATLKNLHIRTGGVCCPGGIASALDLKPWEMKRNFSSGFRCGTEQDIIAGKPTGIIRASLGAMSTISDVDFCISFVKEFYQERTALADAIPVQNTSTPLMGLQIQGINVYPIKSCGGYPVPLGTAWEVKPEGLAWDREWCLVHQGSGQALSQKRFPKMAQLKPTFDFNNGTLCITYRGEQILQGPNKILIPLSENPAHFDSKASTGRNSRVCGDKITPQIYSSSVINGFFSDILGVSCLLARFPAGGQGLGLRHSKAKLQKHQQVRTAAPALCPGAFPELPSPPDSDSEQPSGNILLSNESPILLINTASLCALNRDIAANGGKAVPPDAFRANLVVGTAAVDSWQLSWAEDMWTSLSIGQNEFSSMGSCRRCQMVCVDQETGEKHQEPFVTLAKVRRFDGKVYFGIHLCYKPSKNPEAKQSQCPTIRVGDFVQVNTKTR